MPTSPDPTPNTKQDPAELERRLCALEQMARSFAPAWALEKLDEASSSHSAPACNGDSFSFRKSSLYGKTHWSDGSHIFRNISAFLNAESDCAAENEITRRLKLDMRATVLKYKTLAKSLKSSQPGRYLPSPDMSLPSKAVADQMAQLYVSRFESVFRIVHVPSFWDEYGQYWSNPLDTPDAIRIKVQLVVAIGSSLCPEAHSTQGLRSAAAQTVHDAQRWISGPLEKNRISISGLQIQCLLILARQVLNVGGDLVWVTMGTVVRTAMHMGLHRDPRHFKKITILHSEIRRRLWATILEMNVQAALDAGSLPAISFDDFDTEPPSNCNDEDLHDEIYELEQRPDDTVTDASLQRHILTVLRPRVEIVRCMNSARKEVDYEEVMRLNSVIMDACRRCFTLTKRAVSDGGEVFRRNMGDLLLRRFLIPLHRPWVDRARKTTLFFSSRKQSLDVAMALLSPPRDEGFSHLCMLGGGIFKHRLIHVTLTLLMELLVEIDEHDGSQPPEEPCSYRKMLMTGVEETRRQWEQRVQLCDTSMKLHMKICMILGQAEGAETGIALQQSMAQHGKASLESSYSLLEGSSGLQALDAGPNGNSGDFLHPGDNLEFLDFDDIWRFDDLMAHGTVGHSFW
ncbi:unnamed protein product [Clonostachys byssicola]|uniref:Xylanolytic transcriptional activator regulatory domain-containing protein n=1 Tax=Clonostachys byssicola TaxID=160290 RepID=A0A9N9UB40_9HYPO|nr:unnamed protein product [Clonostachys byssicola]